MAEDVSPRPPPATPAPDPVRFGRYEVPRRADGLPHRLGHGAMGVTYRAWDSRLRRHVALKVIDAALLGGDSRARQRFFREASAAAQLHHPHIATVFDIGEEGGEDFYVMELIDGEDLLSRLRREGPLDVPTVLYVGQQVAQALGAAWRQRIVHRDIKPANLMLARPEPGRPGGVMVKVVDFGLAKALSVSVEASAAISRTAAFFGTAAYASPEQIEATEELDVRSDLYSLGVTLWHLLTGRPTFGNTSLRQAIAGHLVRPPPFADLRASGVSESLVELLGRLLEKDRAERPDTPEAVQAAFEELLRVGVTAPAPSSPVPVGATAPEVPSPAPPATGAPGDAPPPPATFSLVDVLRRRGALPAAEVRRLLGPLCALVASGDSPGDGELDLAAIIVTFTPSPPAGGERLLGEALDIWPAFALTRHSGGESSSSAATVGEQTVAGANLTDGPRGRGAVVAMASLVYELLSGQRPLPGRFRPLPALDEAGNQVLRRAFAPLGEAFENPADFTASLHAVIAADPRPALPRVAPPTPPAVPTPALSVPRPASDGPPEPPRDYFMAKAGLDLVWVRPGAFRMGSPENPWEEGRCEDESLHLVTLREGFWLGRHPVTQGEYRDVTGVNPSHFQGAGDRAPVENVTWAEATDFCGRLTQRERQAGRLPAGYAYRLPTEARWEYACRAGSTTAVYPGEPVLRGRAEAPELDLVGWYAGNSAADYPGAWDSSAWADQPRGHRRAGPQPVGLKAPNAWGLHDLLGNVWEWCEDVYSPYGARSESGGEAAANAPRVLRGGAWSCGARYCRAAFRLSIGPAYRAPFVGFRVALAPGPSGGNGKGD